LVFKNWHIVVPEDGPYVPKYFGEAHLLYVLIKNVHSVGTINGVR